MTWKTCQKCSRLFPTDASHKKLCTVCWKRDHGIDLFPADRELDVALDRIRELDAQLASLAAAPRPVKVGIPRDRLNALIGLCHPDRHQGSEKATQVTQWLLSLREKSR